MAYTLHEITALIVLDQEKAKETILEALRDAGMHKGNAAKALGCNHTTLIRWLDKLDLNKKVDNLIKKAEKGGWRFNGRTGRPRGTTIENGAKPRGKTKAKKVAARKKTKGSRAHASQ